MDLSALDTAIQEYTLAIKQKIEETFKPPLVYIINVNVPSTSGTLLLDVRTELETALGESRVSQYNFYGMTVQVTTGETTTGDELYSYQVAPDATLRWGIGNGTVKFVNDFSDDVQVRVIATIPHIQNSSPFPAGP